MLLLLMWKDCCNDPAVGDLSDLGDVRERNEVDCMGAGLHSVTDALGEATKFVSKCFAPYCGGWALD